ncbi:ankyrin [Aspergillus sclerotiicarbonarius CBS 121057]|uniref:Ankyrin n=1 Tax=Aspergillus sclerotiicarbonarius (strain CBS 121057 / IBT 28362) TaxID=1448318 RepID=A0A319DUV6_ASPSB|nr:ankyrin [Aspergillus sclerotiicarbonarius CBS 121057]
MRLINVNGLETESGLKIEELSGDKIRSYAILSHTWGKEEVTLQEMDQTYKMRRKVIGRMHGLNHAWVDTCCIDKTSSAELSEAINSMYQWYLKARVCYVFLADVTSMDDFANSQWFTRGWTLQELIAPKEMIFYNKYWEKLGTKQTLWKEIEARTGIPASALERKQNLERISIAQKMSWAANRCTSKPEDRAYSLLGLFDINMPLLYGEGEKAFIRLQEELMKAYGDPSILVWASKYENHGGLLATSPDAFEGSRNIEMVPIPHTIRERPWTVDNKGVHLNIPLLPVGHAGLVLGILCGIGQFGGDTIGIFLQDESYHGWVFHRAWSDRYKEIENGAYFRANFPTKEVCVPQPRLAATGTPTSRDNTATEIFDIDYLTFIWMSSWEAWERRMSRPGPQPLDRSNMKRFLQALDIGDILSARELLDKEPSIMMCSDSNGRALLSCTAGNGNVRIVWMILVRLMRYGIGVNDKCDQGRTPLSYAAAGGHIEVIWLLCNWNGIDLYAPDKQGLTPWSHAVREGRKEVIEFLLAQPQCDRYMVDASGRTLLSHAVECGRGEVLELLLQRTSESYLRLKDHQGLSALDWGDLWCFRNSTICE